LHVWANPELLPQQLCFVLFSSGVVQPNDCLASEAVLMMTFQPLLHWQMTNKGMQLEDQVGWLILFDQIPQGLADS